jgi:hypothetical protein
LWQLTEGTCTYEFTQATHKKGYAVTKVRHEKVVLTMDVPTKDGIIDWAATSYKSLPGQVVFHDFEGGAVSETLAWEIGYCVGYKEDFASNDLNEGAYICHLTIASPKLTVQCGALATSQSPALGGHSSPQLAAPVLEEEQEPALAQPSMPGAWPEEQPASQNSDVEELPALPTSTQPPVPKPQDPEAPKTWLTKLGAALGSQINYKSVKVENTSESQVGIDTKFSLVEQEKKDILQGKGKLLGLYGETKAVVGQAPKKASDPLSNAEEGQANNNLSSSPAQHSKIPSLAVKTEAGALKVSGDKMGGNYVPSAPEVNTVHGKGELDLLAFSSDGHRTGLVAKLEGTAEIAKAEIKPTLKYTIPHSLHNYLPSFLPASMHTFAKDIAGRPAATSLKISWPYRQVGLKFGVWAFKDTDKDEIKMGIMGSPGLVKRSLPVPLSSAVSSAIPGLDLETVLFKKKVASTANPPAIELDNLPATAARTSATPSVRPRTPSPAPTVKQVPATPSVRSSTEQAPTVRHTDATSSLPASPSRTSTSSSAAVHSPESDKMPAHLPEDNSSATSPSAAAISSEDKGKLPVSSSDDALKTDPTSAGPALDSPSTPSRKSSASSPAPAAEQVSTTPNTSQTTPNLPSVSKEEPSTPQVAPDSPLANS